MTWPRVDRAPPWRDLVFHVLAHVAATAHLPASLHDARYVAFVEGVLGPAATRSLGEDCRVLGRVLATHRALARAQTVAWLFDDPVGAAHVSARELRDLAPQDVASPVALRAARDGTPALEVLRAAAELEADAHARLPEARGDLDALAAQLAALEPVAPTLRSVTVRVSRALGLRGRVFGNEVVVGCPGELGRGAEHAGWQAAHEATVLELGGSAALDEREREHAALVLLSERARARGFSREHGIWLAHFGERPPVDRATLPSAARRAVDACLERA